MEATRKLSLPMLAAMVVGSMVGAGIFSLPRTFAGATGPVGAVIAWAIAGGGMYMLARVFQSLAERKPDLDAGVFAYAKAGFGDYPGFLSAFGYWIGSCIGNVSYWVLIKATLGAFFPVFGDGNTIPAVLVASVGVWLFHAMILMGIRNAAFVNAVVTVAKIIPILVFVAILAFAFDAGLFRANLWGGPGLAQTSLFEQVRATMLVTVFVFIGVEGASVYSRYAQKRADVGVATILGFLGVLCLMVLVTLLPYAVLDRAAVADMRQPSMAMVLEAVVGPWGAIFVSVGLLVSVLGAYLAWSLICAEVLFAAAKAGDMPRVFATENKNAVPAAALWLTNVIVQLLLISTLFSNDAFTLMLNLTSAMSLIPYLFVALYGVKLARSGETYAATGGRNRDLVIAGAATAYTAFMLLAGGLKFLLLSATLYAPGTLLYVWTRREQGRRVFSPLDLAVFAIAALGAVAGVYALVTGAITI
ncbi:basic amino acid/polyamine antiporter [Caulobacter sp. 17J65-9]|uniref:basic amino acid/polyamine antiporter n=1 Tax=Caulobacter sp. 17J65-9 TaxID=2709382 RepID=UPI0013C57B3C|nr:basic amino acid/polyamine antiporter [Caulobacter sp. 17J65-9]NEX93053.1 amino acid permease [Caulobacter sp. 17J65-9]